MKCKIPEIFWHNCDPVLSVDIQPKIQITTINYNVYRLASGGTDTHVLIWHLKLIKENVNEDRQGKNESDDCGHDITLDLAADLTRHQRAVNCVRWSPNGELLASGDDDSVIFIWKQKTSNEPFVKDINKAIEQDKEIWVTFKVLRGHLEDVYDLSWSSNSLHLVSGSVDNSAIIWDVEKGKSLAILKDHKGFVQGVAWDPLNQYIATLSTDRYLRIFDTKTKKVLQRVTKATLPIGKCHPLHNKSVKLYHDDTLQTFFRRLTFTPDGTLLLTPSGVTDCDNSLHLLYTSYIYTRYNLRQPAIVLPCPDQYTVAVSCCPLLFSLRPYNAEHCAPIVPLPYRMIFAVASRCSVYFYDTQQRSPFAIISDIHYTRLTDITWSNDGHIVVVSSTDGFCSLITFETGELGELYEGEAIPTLELLNTSMNGDNKSKQKQKKKIDKRGNSDRIDIECSKKEKPDSKFSTKHSLNSDTDYKINTKSDHLKNKCEKMKEQPSANESKDTNNTITSPSSIFTDVGSDKVLKKEEPSSDKKFETPKKRCQSATPISIRRHPRSSTASIEKAAITTSPTTSNTLKYK